MTDHTRTLDWVTERAKDVQRTLRFEQPFEQVENIADALRDARTEERKAIAARLREPDEVMVEAVARAISRMSGLEPDGCASGVGWTNNTGEAGYTCHQRHWETFKPQACAATPAIADVLDPSPPPGETNTGGKVMADSITDSAIDTLGLELLRELHAICWFCDAGNDGKYALIPSAKRQDYEPGGSLAALTSLGCVRLLKHAYCATIGQHRPALRMEQFGRRVLRRTAAMGIDLDLPPGETREGE